MNISGFFVVNKPRDWTSHDVVQKVRRLLGKGVRVGHLGTLDPIAQGVLVLCVGKATRLAQYLQAWDKEYQVVLKLGEATDTQDATGRVTSTASLEGITEERIREAFRRFEGPIVQIPPMYSAKKVKGRPLYRLARQGIEVSRPPKAVVIHRLSVERVALPWVTFSAHCSTGTYMRTLCHDVGQALGVGGHLYALTRTRTGPFRLEDAVSVDELVRLAQRGELEKALHGLRDAMQDMPPLQVSRLGGAKMRRGQPLVLGDLEKQPPDAPEGTVYRVETSAGTLLGLARRVLGSGGQALFRVERVLLEVS